MLPSAVGLIPPVACEPKLTAPSVLRQKYSQAHELKDAVAALRKSEQQLRAFAEMSADWFWEQGPDLRFLRQSNIPQTSLPTDVGKSRWEFADLAMDPRRWDAHKADLAARRPFRDFRWERIQTDGKRRYMSTSGDPVFDKAGNFLGYHGTGRDMTADVETAEALRRAIEQAEAASRANAYLAHHDALTGLPNRTLLNDRLDQALNLVGRNGGALAVLALDLDRFKAINDAFGHAAGDQLLVLVADRLKAALSASDTLARVGGDEFIIIHTDVGQPVAAGALAQRLIKLLSELFELNDIQMRIGCSIGIAMYSADGDTAAPLLKNADIALYRAKADRRSGFQFFEVQMDLRLRDRWSLEQDLRLAIGTEQLRLHYQPVFASATRSITGFEALLRWQHPVRGNVAPMAFIPIAEETGLIMAIGAWTLEEACRMAATWAKPKRIAVNLSAAQLRSGQLPTQVADILRRTGLPARQLELEVTETMLIGDHLQALTTLQDLRDLGVQVSCDDFGTGYSSFSYIQKLAFDRIKIDKSFVQELGINPSALRIVQAILAMAQSLGMDVTGEGVETEEQFSLLREFGCGEIQGFLLGQPMPAETVAGMLTDDRGRTRDLPTVGPILN
jgi:diguanylate cyclase (GGDEF)-like protein